MKTMIARSKPGFVLILSLLLLQVTTICAQKPGYKTPPNRDKIEAQRIAFITQELELTPDEAKLFWPVYNEYDAKRRELRKTFKDANDLRKDEIAKLSEKEAIQMLDAQIIEAQKLLDLRKEYHTKFKSVLPAVKVLKLYDVEREFQKRLLDRLRQNKQGPPPPMDKP